MSIEKLHDQQLNGLALDLMHAKNNIFLFREIKNNWEKINEQSLQLFKQCLEGASRRK